MFTRSSNRDPQPVPLLINNASQNRYELDEKSLRKLIRDNDVGDLPAMIISVAGAFRKGKSFLLNFILRYLESADKNAWIGEDDRTLEGFNWRKGSKRETVGILVWSKVFKVKDANGQNVAVFIMDTEGTFDKNASSHHDAVVFTLCTLMSSVQIYNLMQLLNETDLQHLSLCAEYGGFAANETKVENTDGRRCKQFQTLFFLIRDWCNAEEYDHGEVGGKRYLEDHLSFEEDSPDNIKLVREQISFCFEELECFLMPPPGDQATRGREFKGSVGELDGEFKEFLVRFVELILAPGNLRVKKINGKSVRCDELADYCRVYMTVLNSGRVEAKDIYQAAVEGNLMAAVNTHLSGYSESMESCCGGTTHVDAVIEKHRILKPMTMESFDLEFSGTAHASVYLKYMAELDSGVEERLRVRLLKTERERLSQLKSMFGLATTVVGTVGALVGWMVTGGAVLVGAAITHDGGVVSAGAVRRGVVNILVGFRWIFTPREASLPARVLRAVGVFSSSISIVSNR